jgi:hypothetical protein
LLRLALTLLAAKRTLRTLISEWGARPTSLVIWFCALLSFPRTIIAIAMTASLIGCRGWQETAPNSSVGGDRQSLLKPVDLAADGFRLEIVTVRFPLGDMELNERAWTQIDEQSIPIETRQKLADNGLRAGLIVGQIPAEIVRLLTAAEQPATLTEAAANFAQTPVVSRQHMQLHSGWRGQVVASRTYDEIPLLLRNGNDVIGRPYRLAQGVFNVGAATTGDRRVKLQLIPELHHGEQRQTFVAESEDGQLRPQSGKQKKVFDSLTFEASLAPEQMLIITSLPQLPGTLGHYFFTEQQADQVQQKLMLVRLDQTRHSDLFVAPKMAGDFPAVK